MKARPQEIILSNIHTNCSPILDRAKNLSPIPNNSFFLSQKYQISPVGRNKTLVSLSLHQKRVLEKDKSHSKISDQKLPEYIISPFPLNKISQEDNNLNFTNTSFFNAHNLSQGLSSPEVQKESNEKYLKKQKEDIELILANMQELSSFVKPNKAKKVLNRSLEVQRNPLVAFFDAPSNLSDDEKLSQRSNDSLTLILKAKEPFKNRYRRKSCYCTECGGLPHLENEIQNNPHVPATIVHREPPKKKSLHGFAVIKQELGNLLSVNKKQPIYLKHSPTNRKIGSRMQLTSQQEIVAGKSMRNINDDNNDHNKNEHSKERKKEQSIGERPRSQQEGGLKSGKTLESKAEKNNGLGVGLAGYSQEARSKVQITVNGSPRSYIIRKDVLPNQSRQNSIQPKKRTNITEAAKKDIGRRLNTNQSNRMTSYNSVSPRNLSLPSETPRKDSVGPEEVRFRKKEKNERLTSNNMRLDLSPKSVEPEQAGLKEKRIVVKQFKMNDRTEMNKTEGDFSINFDVKDRANLKEILRKQVKVHNQDNSRCETENFKVEHRVEKNKKINLRIKKKLKEFMGQTSKDRNHTMLKIYMSTSTSNFRVPNSKTETSHSKDFRDGSCDEKDRTRDNSKSNKIIIRDERANVESRGSHLRRLVNFNKDESPYKK